MLAYIDPGAGSFILQALVAAFAGAAVVVNNNWQKIKRFLTRSSGKDAARKASEDDPPREG